MKQFGENFFIGGPSAVGNDLYFTGGGSGVWQIYRSNGTEMGTGPITAPGIVGARFTAFAGQIVFAGDSRATTTEVFALDDSPAGVRLVKDVFPGLDRGVYSPYFVRSGSLLYFNGDDGVHGIEPWTIAQPDAVLDAPAGGITSHALEFTLGAAEPTLNDPTAVYTYSVDWGDGTSGSFSGPSGTRVTHTYPTLGTYTVSLVVTDRDGFSSEPTIATFTVSPNSAPTLAPITVSITETAFAFTAMGSDVNVGDVLTYSLGVGAPAGSAINPQTGAFTWTPGPAQLGSYTFPVRVTDSDGLFAEQTVTLTTLGVVDGELVYVGSAKADNVRFSPAPGGGASVYRNAQPVGSFNGVSRIAAYGLGGRRLPAHRWRPQLISSVSRGDRERPPCEQGGQ